MADYNSLYQQSLYLSPEQQDLLLAALTSNNPSRGQEGKSSGTKSESGQHASSSRFNASPSGDLDLNSTTPFGIGDDQSPFLDFNPDVDLDFEDAENLIGDFPGGSSLEAKSEESDNLDSLLEPREKRKEIDDDSPENETEESGKKRKESYDKAARKPGRKPLTSEPTTKRKAQNRAAQRAFRERKEKHLSDLELRVEKLQKASMTTNQENGLLRAQVERLQLELMEYRKRLSWMSSGISAMNAIPSAHSKGAYGLKNNDFLFDFPKFGNSPNPNTFNNSQLVKVDQDKSNDGPASAGRQSKNYVPGILNLDTLGNSVAKRQQSFDQDSATKTLLSRGDATESSMAGKQDSSKRGKDLVNSKTQKPKASTPKSNSPSSSSDSHHSQLLSSCRTSPEPNSTSPSADKFNDSHAGHKCGGIDGEQTFCEQLGLACGSINDPVPAVRRKSDSASHSAGQPANSAEQPLGLDWLTQQNGGQFDPVLFGDWREPQDAVLSQDFGAFFNDAFHMPDLDADTDNQQPPKNDLIAQIDRKLEEDDEVVPGEDKAQLLTCTKIWDRLQSMDRFRNGEIDVDNLCSELRTKAQCSEGGVVVNKKDVECIMGRVGRDNQE